MQESQGGAIHAAALLSGEGGLEAVPLHGGPGLWAVQRLPGQDDGVLVTVSARHVAPLFPDLLRPTDLEAMLSALEHTDKEVIAAAVDEFGEGASATEPVILHALIRGRSTRRLQP